MTLRQETSLKGASLKVQLLTGQTGVLRHDTYMGTITAEVQTLWSDAV